MRLKQFINGLALGAGALIAGCTSVTETPSTQPSATPSEPPAAPPAIAEPAKPSQPLLPAITLDGYKQHAARRIVDTSEHTFNERLPDILKSVVVLDITVDHTGHPTRVVVRRSNGYTDLEHIAMNSVKKAAPLPAPSLIVLRGQKSISYLETFLFRADGKFQVRSLAEPQRTASKD